MKKALIIVLCSVGVLFATGCISTGNNCIPPQNGGEYRGGFHPIGEIQTDTVGIGGTLMITD